MVTLETKTDFIYTSYPASRMEDAIALWKRYVQEGKKATLTVEGVDPK